MFFDEDVYNESLPNNFPGKPIIYTTGAFLSPQRIVMEDGYVYWGWVVEGFEQDSYFDGKTFNPKPLAETRKDLLRNVTLEGWDDEDEDLDVSEDIED